MELSRACQAGQLLFENLDYDVLKHFSLETKEEVDILVKTLKESY